MDAFTSWTTRNIGQLSDKAYSSAFTIKNITSSFKAPGIWPINRLAFSDDDFTPSTVTDFPLEQNQTDLLQDPREEDVSQTNKNIIEIETIPDPVIDKDLAIQSTSFNKKENSFEGFRPLPKISGEKRNQSESTNQNHQFTLLRRKIKKNKN